MPRQILLDMKEYLLKQPSLVDVTIPEQSKFTVCGDIHGQFYDLLNIFQLNGVPSEDNPYLFNGDFVDRGSFSVECILTLFGFKLLYPNHFFMSRGKHPATLGAAHWPAVVSSWLQSLSELCRMVRSNVWVSS